jgi:hypothetical protein
MKRASRSETNHRLAADEAGAILILALLFMVAGSLLILGLLGWSGNQLNSVASFEQSRALNYAANNAMETAIQQVRYSSTACPSTGLQIPSNGLTMVVYCSGSETDADSAASRQITFTACTSADTQSQCSANPYLTAIATFGDFSASNPTYSSICAAGCGSTITINEWVFSSTV